jgi:pyruvate,water dikinase
MEARKRFSLTDRVLEKLVQLGMRVEGYYHTPQDIEWGLVGEDVFLLQTRPITTLWQNPSSLEVSPTKRLSAFQHRILDDLLEHFPEAPYPLEHASVVDTYQPFLDATHDLGISMTEAKQMIRMDESGRPFVEIGRVGVNLRLLGLPWSVWQKLRRDPARWSKSEDAQFAERLQALGEVQVDQLDDMGLVEHTKQANALASQIGNLRFSEYIYPSILRAVWLKVLMRLAGERSAESFDLLGDLSFKTAEIHHALSALAKTARRIPSISAWFCETAPPLRLEDLANLSDSSAFLDEVDAFLKLYGARTNKVYLPFSNLSWGEQPSALLAALAVLVRSPDAGADGEAQRTERYRQLVQRITAKLPWFLRGAFARTLVRFREGHIAREGTLFRIEGAFVEARRGVYGLAKRFVAQGILPEQNDVRYLTLEEIEKIVDKTLAHEAIKSRVLLRKKARRTAQSVWQARPILAETPEKGAFKGIAGSPGRATGNACIVTGVDAFFKLQEGDILVCPYTDPTWTPLFAMASAVVADTGGPLSHAAIVAREYQIPAVLGLPNATTTFRDGMRLSVDGATGLVRVLGEVPDA